MRLAVAKFNVHQQRGFWLRCFLGKALFAIPLCLAISPFLWAKIEMQGPIHLWRIHGYFVNPVGKPLENIEVTLVRDGAILHKTRTDATGRFAFDHVSGRYLLHIDKSPDYSQLSREVIVGVETLTMLHSNTLYVIAGPGACADDCSSVFTSKKDFEKTIRRNTAHHY